MPKRQRICIVGAGGFAREVAWLIREISRETDRFELVGHVVSDLSKLCDHDSREAVLGDYDWLERELDSVDALACGIGTPSSRLRVATELEARFPNLAWPVLAHPTATFDRASTDLARGTIVCAGVVGTVNLALEPFAMVNLCCTLGHEARIGAGSVLNPSVNVSGGVNIGRGVLVGTGAQILQYVNVGDLATVGAGAVVTKDVAAGVTVVGVPAKPARSA